MGAGFGLRRYALTGRVIVPSVSYAANDIMPIAGILDYTGNRRAPITIIGGTVSAADVAPLKTLRLHIFGRPLLPTEIPNAEGAIGLQSSLGPVYGTSEFTVKLQDLGNARIGHASLGANAFVHVPTHQQSLEPHDSYNDPQLGFLIECRDAQDWRVANRQLDIVLIGEST